MFLPNTEVLFKSALVGGLMAGFMWQVAGILFSTFVVGSSNYSAVYSSFAILILALGIIFVIFLQRIIYLISSNGFYYLSRKNNLAGIV